MSKITDFINQEEETGVVNAYIPKTLRTKMVAQFKADKEAGKEINWDKFLEAACLAYLDERKGKKVVG
jgi:hypothetical protein